MSLLIGRFEHLPNRPRSDEARPLLEKIASQVKPIMVKRGWKVGTLAEFLPANPALLGNNMNHGQQINLRLRPPGDTSTFYEYDQLVLVMLHELTHIVHGPHDANFYKLLGELEEEFYSLKRKGYEGEGFHSAGNRLHGVRVNEYDGRRRGLAAAEKRLNQAKALGRGGVLGGTSRNAGKTMREIVAEAAERRLQDDKACDTTHTAEVEEEIRKAQAESVGIDAKDIIDLTASSDDDAESIVDTTPTPVDEKETKKRPLRAATPAAPAAPAARRPPPMSKPASSGERIRPPKLPATSSSATPTPPISVKEDWACPTCTLINPMSERACQACTAPRPPQSVSAAGWFCDFCGAGPRDMGMWSCGECSWVRKWG